MSEIDAAACKMKTMYRIATILFLGMLLWGRLPAQERISESELQIQMRFIDANREKLLGNYDKAIPLLEEILKDDDQNDAAAYELARVYDLQEDYEKAVRYARQAIDLAPANDWYKVFLAEIYQKMGRNEEAADLYADLVKAHPENDGYYFRRAYFLVRADKITDAVKVYDELERRIGINEELIRRKHALYLGVGDTKNAGKELERLIRAFPSNLEYQHLLASFYEQIGDSGNAEDVYRNILAADPNDVKARLALAGVPRSDSDEIRYIESLRPIFEKEDVNIDLKIGKIMPFIQKVADTGDRALAGAALDLSAILERVHPDDAKSFSVSADLLYYSGQRRQAIEKYRQTLQLDETVYLVWQQLLTCYLEEKDYRNLARTAENALDVFPNKAFNYYVLGIADASQGQYDDALASLEQALLMVGNDGQLQLQVQSQLGNVYAAMERFSESDKAYDAALALNPKDPLVLRTYAYQLAQRTAQLDKAEEMAKMVNQLQPSNPHNQHIYGWVLYRKKKYNDARKWIGQALEDGGADDPEILEHYGDVLFQLNDSEGALSYWVKAQENGSTSKLLEKKINDKQLYE